MVYIKKLRVAVCTKEEIERFYRTGGEAGVLLESLVRYLERLAEGK
jgi:hypothetical protein